MVRNGRMTQRADGDLAGLLQAMLQQQTAMLQVQAESVRLQRLLVERLLGAASDETPVNASGVATAPPSTTAIDRQPLTTADPHASASPPGPAEIRQDQVAVEFATEASPADSLGDAAVGVPSPGDQNAARGARYYQPRPSPAVKTVKPEDLELMRRLHEMRDASDLILQFGPYKGTTLAQVAMSHPEYVRQLMTRAQRPEVRAAAGRLVEALDAAAEHKRKTGRGASRRGRSPI
jgi:hypothetical protein